VSEIPKNPLTCQFEKCGNKALPKGGKRNNDKETKRRRFEKKTKRGEKRTGRKRREQKIKGGKKLGRETWQREGGKKKGGRQKGGRQKGVRGSMIKMRLTPRLGKIIVLQWVARSG
jgi:hypothetical protein